MKVFFVGIHNKPGTPPLCSTTRSGKMIDRVIDQIELECVKTNLFDVDYMPSSVIEQFALVDQWNDKYNPADGDIIVLLGKAVQDGIIRKVGTLLRFAHPASIRSNIRKDDYVRAIVEAIKDNQP